MTENDHLLEVLEHPEQITEEFYRNCPRCDQFMILLIRPDFREVFLGLHGSFSRGEEFELIMNHQLDCESAVHKSEFTGHDIREFIIEGVLGAAEFRKMNYAERLTSRDWSAILADTDPDCIWREFCDFSGFDNSDWVNLLACNPEYADCCPLEKLERSDIDALLREQPELAERFGIADAVELYLVNDAPHETGGDDTPFYPPLPPDAPCEPLTVWLKNSFPEMTGTDVARYVHRICFRTESLLGVYSRSAAEKKMTEISPRLKKLKNLRLEIRDKRCGAGGLCYMTSVQKRRGRRSDDGAPV